MSIKVGLKELRSGDLQSRIEQAQILTKSLSQMKGAAMKAGQLLSLEIADYFPPEATEILTQLQSQSTAEPFEIVENILKIELSGEKFNSLKNISQNPIASASIAQIHTAYLAEQKVALKIQHPGVSESIDSDLAILKKTAQVFCSLTNKQMNLEPAFEEIKAVFKQEVNFQNEMSFLQSYEKNFKDLKEKNTFYVTPKVFPEYCTDKLLVMSFEEGLTIPLWLKTNPSVLKKEKLAHLALNLYCLEFFKFNTVQTDPNFSNYLIREKNQELELVLLDFGATKCYEKDFVIQYVDLLKTIARNDKNTLVEKSIRFGLLDARESENSIQYYKEMMDIAVEPFLVDKFDFSNMDYSKKSTESIRKFASSLKYSAPPYKIIFLHRRLGGLFALQKKLAVQIDVRPYWQKMIETDSQ